MMGSLDLVEPSNDVGRTSPESPATSAASQLRLPIPAVSGCVLLLGWGLWAFGLGRASWAPFAASFVLGVWPCAKAAFTDLVTSARVGPDFLMCVAGAAALATGHVKTAATLAFLCSVVEAAKILAVVEGRKAAIDLARLAPGTATLRRMGRDREIPARSLSFGDIFVVAPGRRIPTDGIVHAGLSTVNQTPVTGEAHPVDKSPGDAVLAGTVNGASVLDIEVTATFHHNTVRRMAATLVEAHQRVGPGLARLYSAERTYSAFVLIIGVSLALGWLIPPGADAQRWIARAIAFVAVAAPCALPLSVVVATLGTLGLAAHRGVLIKGGDILERLASVRAVALEKTGILTIGEPTVADVVIVDRSRMGPDEAVQLAAAIERHSDHPVARAIVRYAESKRLFIPGAEQFRTLDGIGIEGVVGGRTVFIGQPNRVVTRLPQHADFIRRQMRGETVVLLRVDGRVSALFGLRDNLRRSVAPAVESLRNTGVRKVVVLTGDSAITARAIASEAGVDAVEATLAPDEKRVALNKLAIKVGNVAMVGDGIGGLALMPPGVLAVALNGAGSEQAYEFGDVVLMGEDLHGLARAISLGRRWRAIVRQNVALSIVVAGTLATGALAGLVPLPVALIGPQLCALALLGNALRATRM